LIRLPVPCLTTDHPLYWINIYQRPTMPPILIVPGWGNSSADHWQTWWERELPDARRVEMPDWNEPQRDGWVRALDASIAAAEAPPIVVAHSLGCVALAFWARTAPRGHAVRGALCVAPPDLARPSLPVALREFGPVPLAPLPFVTQLVVSDDDPYASLACSRTIADRWGARLAVVSRAGHINAASGFGPWRDGRAWLDAVVAATRPAGPSDMPAGPPS
jgi:predicted alpha/beta hydrolase family esterase